MLHYKYSIQLEATVEGRQIFKELWISTCADEGFRNIEYYSNIDKAITRLLDIAKNENVESDSRQEASATAGSLRNFKIDPVIQKFHTEVLAEVKRAFEQYKSEVNAAGYTRETQKTYIDNARQFVRWMDNDFKVGRFL